MNEFSVPCAAVDQGTACRLNAAMIEPVPLCIEHRLQVALLVVPDVLAEAMRLLASGETPKTLPEGERNALVAGARALDVRPYLAGGMHGPIVYFIENGDRIKIGYSTNLRSRIQAFALQDKNVLMILQGGLTLERALHAVFARDRIDATEWFVKSEAIVGYIEAKLADRDTRHRQNTQHQQRKHMMTAAPAASTGRRNTADWAAIALPLYQQYAATAGRAPTAPELAAILVEHGHVALKPSRARDIRSATHALAMVANGQPARGAA